MIKLVKITGETYDIETGKETGKGIVLSNGHEELHIPVRDEDVRDIILLQMKAKEAVIAVPTGVVGKPADPNPYTEEENLGEGATAVVPLASVADSPAEDEPGPEFDDSSTGTASI
jgi:hypothetical protein